MRTVGSAASCFCAKRSEETSWPTTVGAVVPVGAEVEEGAEVEADEEEEEEEAEEEEGADFSEEDEDVELLSAAEEDAAVEAEEEDEDEAEEEEEAEEEPDPEALLLEPEDSADGCAVSCVPELAAAGGAVVESEGVEVGSTGCEEEDEAEEDTEAGAEAEVTAGRSSFDAEVGTV